MKTVLPCKILPALPRAGRKAGADYGLSDAPNWRSVDWGAHLRQIEVDGTRVNYVDIGEQGERRPIVFVHGLAGQWQNWLENIPRFAQDRRVVAIDLPGFGLSEMPREPISIELYGNFVADICSRLKLAPAVLVGNSMGGFVTAEVALRAPEVVERLMLLSSAGVSQMDIARGPLLAAGKVAALLSTATDAQKRWVACHPLCRHWVMDLVCRHPTRIKPDAMYEGLMKGGDKPGFSQALRAILVYDFRSRLPQMACPTLVVWGEKDMLIPVKDADGFVNMIGGGTRKIVMKNTGHVPMFERPQTFNDVLQDFLYREVSDGELEGELEATPSPVAASAARERDETV